MFAWQWLNASHLYRSSLLPGRAGAVALLLYRAAALALYVIGLLYQEYAKTSDPKHQGLNPKFMTFFTNWCDALC
jgi:hypothetical protein